MTPDSAVQLLTGTTPSTPISTLSAALSTLSGTHSTLPSASISLLSRTLIDKVVPLLSSCAPTASETALRHLESLLLSLDPPTVFSDLISSLETTPETGDMIARILILFIHEPLGAVSRLSAILSSPNLCDLVSSLVHLPSKLHNVLNSFPSDSPAASGPPGTICETDFISCLSAAMVQQGGSSDAARDPGLCELLRRLVRMKHAGTMVARFLRAKTRAASVCTLLRAPPTAMSGLVRALINARASDEEGVVHVLSDVIRESEAGVEACVNEIPFVGPLLRRPKCGIRRMVGAMEKAGGHKLIERGLQVAAIRWAGEEFSLQGGMQEQRQVTRLVLWYLRKGAKGYEGGNGYAEEVMLTLVEGVHFRLGDNDARMRRHGMVVGEGGARFCGEKEELRFERGEMKGDMEEDRRVLGDEKFEDGGDSDFSELAELVGRGDSEDEEWEAGGIGNKEGESGVQAKGSEGRNEATSRECGEEGTYGCGTGFRREWGEEEDWSSVGCYSSSSGGEDWTDEVEYRKDYERMRSRIAAPMSVGRILGLLREVNESGNGGVSVSLEETVGVLRIVGRRSRDEFWEEGRGGLRVCAGELLREVLGIECERWGEEGEKRLRGIREECMVGLVELDVVDCGEVLVKVFGESGSDIGKRSEGVGVLIKGLRGGWEKIRRRKDGAEEAEEAEEEDTKIKVIGKVTRRSRRKPRVSKGNVVVIGWRDEDIGKVFYGLARVICEGDENGFLDLNGRDCQLLGQAVIAMSVIGGICGVSDEGCELREQVIRIIMEKIVSECGDVVVKRACCLGLSSIFEKMGAVEIGRLSGDRHGSNCFWREEKEGLMQKCVNWLEKCAEKDLDVGVRRLGGRGLSILASRMRKM